MVENKMDDFQKKSQIVLLRCKLHITPNKFGYGTEKVYQKIREWVKNGSISNIDPEAWGGSDWKEPRDWGKYLKSDSAWLRNGR